MLGPDAGEGARATRCILFFGDLSTANESKS